MGKRQSYFIWLLIKDFEYLCLYFIFYTLSIWKIRETLPLKKNYSVHLIAIIRNSSVERGKDNFPYHDFVL